MRLLSENVQQFFIIGKDFLNYERLITQEFENGRSARSVTTPAPVFSDIVRKRVALLDERLRSGGIRKWMM